jgi:hypothetical protein
VTIIAGFKCDDGIVICSDTQETVLHSKRQVSKLRYERASFSQEVDRLSAAFCGAGDGPFIDKIVENCWAAARLASDLDEACSGVEGEIKRTYTEFGSVYQPGFCPAVDLIYGLKQADQSRLFVARGPVVNEKFDYDSSGAGYYMADFLAARMYHAGLNLREGVILAAYVLHQAKEHVEGCGGESQIAVLRNNGISGRVDPGRINAITECLKFADRQTGGLLLSTADVEIDDEAFSELARSFESVLTTVRQDTRREMQTDASGWFSRLLTSGLYEFPKRDFFGLPQPQATDKTSET